MTKKFCDKCGRFMSDGDLITYLERPVPDDEFIWYELCEKCCDEVIALIENGGGGDENI